MTTLVLILCTLSPFIVYTGQAFARGKVDFLSPAKKESLWGWYRSSGAECIHHHEGAWTDPNPTYYGGFQMNIGFQKAYGHMRWKHIHFVRRYGTANRWPVVVQLLGARHGYNARGWYPWPNTARACGLL